MRRTRCAARSQISTHTDVAPAIDTASSCMSRAAPSRKSAAAARSAVSRSAAGELSQSGSGGSEAHAWHLQNTSWLPHGAASLRAVYALAAQLAQAYSPRVAEVSEIMSEIEAHPPLSRL